MKPTQSLIPSDKCETRREKPVYYPSNKNPSGKSYQKCGRKAVAIWYGKPICKLCAKDKIIEGLGF